MTTISPERLARIFVEVADTLVSEFDLVDFLHMLVTRAAGLIEDATVGLLVTDQHDELRFVAASDESTRLLELFQVKSREGPCMDAYRTGVPVVEVDLRRATARWPLFAPHATRAGYRSVHAFPLRLRTDVIGAMNVFGCAPGLVLSAADVQILQALTDLAAISLLQERSIRRGEVLTGQLQGALNSRITIEQAKGRLAQVHAITADQAFILLRSYARQGNLRLIDVATTVVTDLDRLPGLAVARPPEEE